MLTTLYLQMTALLRDETEPMGGLKNLQREVENAGGIMEIEPSPDFALKLTLPKGEEYVV